MVTLVALRLWLTNYFSRLSNSILKNKKQRMTNSAALKVRETVVCYQLPDILFSLTYKWNVSFDDNGLSPNFASNIKQIKTN